MVEENAEVKKSSSMGVVGEALRPFGSRAYKESREKGVGRLKSVINAASQAFLPGMYSMIERDTKKSISDKNELVMLRDDIPDPYEVTAAIVADLGNNFLALTNPAYAPIRYAYGQVATRLY